MSKSKFLDDIDRESPFISPWSRKTIPAAKVSTPTANASNNMGVKQTHHDHVAKGRVSDYAVNIPSFPAQISSLTAKITTLESMNAKLKVENQKFELTTSQIKGDNDRLKSEIDKIKSEDNKLKEDNDKLKEENSKLKDDNCMLEGTNDNLEDDKDALTVTNEQLKNKTTKLNEDNGELKGDNDRLRDKTDSLESQLSCRDILIRSLKDDIRERGAMLNSSRSYANEVVMGLLASGYDLPNGLPDHLIATYENAMELSKSITKELGPSKLSKHDAGPGSSMSPTLSGKSTDNGNGRVRKGPLLDEPVAKRLKRVHDPQGASQSAADDILRAKDSETDDETSLRSFHSDTADGDYLGEV